MATADRQVNFFFNDITPESCLRIQDQMIVDWLNGLTFRNQHPRTQTAYISRQFAATHEAEEQTNPDVKQAAPFPQISILMTGLVPDITRRNARGFMVEMGPRARIWKPGLHTSVPLPPPSRDPDVIFLEDAGGDAPNGTEIVFQGVLLTHNVPVLLGKEVILQFEIGGELFTETAQATGAFTNANGQITTSSINFSTGAVSVTFVSPPDAASDLKVIIEKDPARWGNRAYVSREKREIYLLPWPLAFDMTYQIDILTKTQADMVMLRSSLLARFDSVDETYLSADFPGYGKQMIRVTFERLDDTSDLETDEKERTLRSTVTLIVHGWIFRVPVRKKTIRNIHLVLIDASGPDTTGRDTLDDESDFMAWYNDPDNYIFNSDGSVLISVLESADFSPPNRVLFWESVAPDGSITTGP